jgi:hypothetical protein
VDELRALGAASQTYKASIAPATVVWIDGRMWRRVVPPHDMLLVATNGARIHARRMRPNLKPSPKTRVLDDAFRRRLEET